jgi:hypothetical protein
MARMLALGNITHECISLSKALFKGAEASAACPSHNNGVKIKKSMEHCWNDTEGGQRKKLEASLSHCDFVHHKSYYGLLWA